MLTDRLIGPRGVVKAWSNARIDTRHSHGTGCTLASAVATGLGQGLDLIDAIERARKYVRAALRSEEHTSELQSLMRISYAVFCLKNKKNKKTRTENQQHEEPN